MDYADFLSVVATGRKNVSTSQENVMPSFGDNKNVVVFEKLGQELDVEMEQAAQSLGASEWTTFRRVIFPNILPGILSGIALAFAKAVGEFGSLVIITGNLPFRQSPTSSTLAIPNRPAAR